MSCASRVVPGLGTFGSLCKYPFVCHRSQQTPFTISRSIERHDTESLTRGKLRKDLTAELSYATTHFSHGRANNPIDVYIYVTPSVIDNQHPNSQPQEKFEKVLTSHPQTAQPWTPSPPLPPYGQPSKPSSSSAKPSSSSPSSHPTISSLKTKSFKPSTTQSVQQPHRVHQAPRLSSRKPRWVMHLFLCHTLANSTPASRNRT